MLRQLLTMLAVLSGLAAAPAAAEVRAAEVQAQVADAADIVVTAERAAVVAQQLVRAPALDTGDEYAAPKRAFVASSAVRIKVDRARE